MKQIQDLIERDLSRQIEEIIKVYQDDEKQSTKRLQNM